MIVRLLDRLFKKTPKRNKDEGNFLVRYWKSFNHALDGLIYCLKYEHNMIIILICTIVVICLGFLFNISLVEWLFVIFICGTIAACEFINSAIEATIDLITTEIHPLAKIAKDCASAASLVLCIVALIGGVTIFGSDIIKFIGGLL